MQGWTSKSRQQGRDESTRKLPTTKTRRKGKTRRVLYWITVFHETDGEQSSSLSVLPCSHNQLVFLCFNPFATVVQVYFTFYITIPTYNLILWELLIRSFCHFLGGRGEGQKLNSKQTTIAMESPTLPDRLLQCPSSTSTFQFLLIKEDGFLFPMLFSMFDCAVFTRRGRKWEIYITQDRLGEKYSIKCSGFHLLSDAPQTLSSPILDDCML